MTTILGIDLGTTNSLCAVFQGGAPTLVPNAMGSFLTPSVVAVTDDGQVLVGEPARTYQILHPGNAAARFKQWMGTDREIVVRGRSFTPPELSSLVLRSLREDAERFLKNTISDVVITVPAYFNDKQRRATRLAATLAGLQVRRMINEPTAAALTYGFHERDAMKHILVLDLGGGTFDVSLMEVFEGSLEIISTAGENFLGGEEFTDRLAAHVCRQAAVSLEQAELRHPHQIAKLRQQCELAKRRLLAEPTVNITMPETDGSIRETSATFVVSREEFAQISQGLFERLKGPIAKALRDGERRTDEIDEVILVGGATRMDPLKQFAREYLQTEPRCEFNPDEVVAMGAAIQAALIVNDAAIDDMVLTDVCPHTLGVDVVKELGQRQRAGFFAPIIHRNTTIPVSREETFHTIEDNQRNVRIDVYQGESRHVSENTHLGTLEVTGIPYGPRGTPLVIRFTYDLNGILEVEAFVEKAQERHRTIITTGATELSPTELQEAVAKMQALKFYPKDDHANVQLLYHAEQCLAEANPLVRAELERIIESYEAAMASGDRDYFHAARSELIVTLSRLGFPYGSSLEGD